MISYLKGQVLDLSEETVVLNVSGIGYEATCSQNTLDQVQGRQEVELWIHTHVREDNLSLFGFSNKTEKQLFLSLIKVSGIGPKVAIKILSATTETHFMNLIESGDVKGLSKLPKIGKKTAEQMVLTLKGKLVLAEEEGHGKKLTGVHKDLFSALTNLGFKENDVQQAIEQMGEPANLEEGVRKGLSLLSGGRA